MLSTTLSISFLSGPENYIFAEFDSVRNEGKSEFNYGDSIYFRVYSNLALNKIDVVASAGDILEYSGTYTGSQTDVVFFQGANIATTTKPVKTISSACWYLEDDVDYGTPEAVLPTTLLIDADIVAPCKITYSTEYYLYKLTAPTEQISCSGEVEDIFYIIILITGDES